MKIIKPVRLVLSCWRNTVWLTRLSSTFLSRPPFGSKVDLCSTSLLWWAEEPAVKDRDVCEGNNNNMRKQLFSDCCRRVCLIKIKGFAWPEVFSWFQAIWHSKQEVNCSKWFFLVQTLMLLGRRSYRLYLTWCFSPVMHGIYFLSSWKQRTFVFLLRINHFEPWSVI